VLEWSLNINPTGARGYVHASERFGIRHPDILKTLSQTFPIALFHHAYFLFEPKSTTDKAFIWSMELIEKESFLETLKKIGIKIALHGHYHHQEKYTIENILFLNSGSVKRSASSINSLTIHPDYSVSQTFHRLHDQ
jgi:predicted phosphodiesterase